MSGKGGRAFIAGMLSAAVLLATAGAAQARPPVLLSVGADGGYATAQWSKEPGVEMRFIEIATSPQILAHGYFNGQYIFSFDVLTADQTSSKDDCSRCVLKPGTKYYLHVVGEDTKNGLKCGGREFSNVLSLVLNDDGTTTVEDRGGGHPPCPPSQGGGGGNGTPPPKTGPGPDRVAPFASLSARRGQDVDKLYVKVRPNEQVTVTATGTVNAPGGAAKLHRFKKVTRSVAARKTTKLRLRLARKSLRAVKRALRRGKRLRARIKVTSKDRAGNTRVDHVSVLLRP